MRFTLIFGLILSILGTWSTEVAQSAENSNRPNIIFVIADDLGYGDLSCYGQKKFTTPHIDRLARDGMKFTQMYSGSTVCAPSRCTLMTGLHTGHSCIRGNGWVKPIGQNPLPPGTFTLTKMLHDAGYSVGVFGKWGLGAAGNVGDPQLHGVDQFFGYYCQYEAHTYYPPRLHENGREILLDGKTYSHDLIMDHALEFIREHRDGPFFCFLPVTIPHAAMQVPEDEMTPWRAKFPEFENVIGRYSHGTSVRNPIAAFPAMVTRLDRGVGELLDLLEELDIADDTLVVFTSDNGPHREGGHDPDFFDSNGQFTGYKRDLTEGGVRVPFLIYWKGHIQAGLQTDHEAAFWDLLPTFAEITGSEVPANLDGISLLPTLENRPEAQKAHDYFYWEFHESGGRRAVRFGNWKAVQLEASKKPGGPVQLYDLSQDISELEDVSAQHPDVVKRARELFEECHTPNPDWPFGGR